MHGSSGATTVIWDGGGAPALLGPAAVLPDGGGVPRYRAGDIIDGRYRVRGVLGRGGMGTVLEVGCGDGRRAFALKYCHLAGSGPGRFAREVRAMERVRHPNVVPVLDANLDHAPPYLLMPLAERSLEGDLPRLRGDEAGALGVLRQVCRGIRALHDAGVVHRDIKPSNVLRFARGRVAVADFGLAKLDARDATALTRTGEFLGTLAYSAPEQLLPAGAREADARTDICQLGKMLYHMLTGRSPALIDPRALPAGLAPIIRRATSALPEDRYPDVGALMAALRAYRPATAPAALEGLIREAEVLLIRDPAYRPESLGAILGLLRRAQPPAPGAAIAHFNRIPEALLPIMAGEFPGELLPIVRGYARALRAEVGRYNFTYAEAVARRMRTVFRGTDRVDLKGAALQATLIAAVTLRRFAAMAHFNRLLTGIRTTDDALAIAEVLRADSALYRKVAGQVPPGRLHPAIRAVRDEVLCGADDPA